MPQDIQRQYLKKPRDARKPQETKEMSISVAKVPFFQKQNLKMYEYIDIAANLEYLKLPGQTNVCTIGEEGDLFYIILTGSCSIWVPVSAAQMKQVFADFKRKVEETNDQLNYHEAPKDLPFDFEFVSDGRDDLYNKKKSGVQITP